jgi:hypothetical protein
MAFLPCPFDEIAMALWPYIGVWCASCECAVRQCFCHLRRG